MGGAYYWTYQLVGDLSMITSCHSLTNSRLHQSRERGKDIDWRVHLSVVQLPVNIDLPFSNVTG